MATNIVTKGSIYSKKCVKN